MAQNTYSVAYSTNARAKCKYSGCGESIAKDDLRFTKSSSNAFSETRPKCEYYHAKCMFLSFVRARPTTKKIESMSDIEGLDKIKSADSDKLKKFLKEFQSGAMKDQVPKITRKRKAEGDDNEPKRKRANSNKKSKKTEDDSDDEDVNVKAKSSKKVLESDSEEDIPLNNKAKNNKKSKVMDESDEEDYKEPKLSIQLKEDKKKTNISKPKPKDEDKSAPKKKIIVNLDDSDDEPKKMKISKDKPQKTLISSESEDDDDNKNLKDSDDEESEDEKPAKKSKKSKKDSDDEDSEDEKPAKKSKKSKKDSDDEDSEDEKPAKKSKAKPKEDSSDEEEDEEVKESNSDNEAEGFLSGKVIALCGKLSMPTDKAVALIEKNGGKYSKTITKAVTHVIVAKPDDKTQKLQKAKESGKILVTESFLKKGS